MRMWEKILFNSWIHTFFNTIITIYYKFSSYYSPNSLSLSIFSINSIFVCFNKISNTYPSILFNRREESIIRFTRFFPQEIYFTIMSIAISYQIQNAISFNLALCWIYVAGFVIYSIAKKAQYDKMIFNKWNKI